MKNIDLSWIKELLYSENNESLKNEIKGIKNSLFLHIIAANYNWDNGFEIPNLIIKNSNCDLGTALMLFYNADGYRFLESTDNPVPSLLEWNTFVTGLYHRILKGDFKSHKISYTHQISKVQVYKLKKSHPNISSIFLERSPGIKVDIPLL